MARGRGKTGADQTGADRLGEVMTVDQVAAYLQLNRLTVYRYVRQGTIPAARIGKVYRLLKADVDRFLEDQKGAATRAAAPQARVRPGRVRDARKAGEISVRAEEISVGPARREPRRNLDLLRLREPLDVIIRGLN